MNDPNEKVYLLIELLTDGLSPHQLKNQKEILLRKLRNCNIQPQPVFTPPEPGSMSGSHYWEKLLLELSPKEQEQIISQAQEQWGENVRLTMISVEDKNSLLNQVQTSQKKTD